MHMIAATLSRMYLGCISFYCRICATPISMNEIDIVLVFLFDLLRICARQYLNRFSAICAQVSHNLLFNVSISQPIY